MKLTALISIGPLGAVGAAHLPVRVRLPVRCAVRASSVVLPLGGHLLGAVLPALEKVDNCFKDLN